MRWPGYVAGMYVGNAYKIGQIAKEKKSLGKFVYRWNYIKMDHKYCRKMVECIHLV